MRLLVAATDHNLASAPDVLRRLATFEAARTAQLRALATDFLLKEDERDQHIAELDKALAHLTSWLSYDTTDHWVPTLQQYLQLDLSWERLWQEKTAGVTFAAGSYEADLEAYRRNHAAIRLKGPPLLRAAAIGDRYTASVQEMRDHAASSFFPDLAAFVDSLLGAASPMPTLATVTDSFTNSEGDEVSEPIVCSPAQLADVTTVATNLVADPVTTAQAESLGGERLDLDAAVSLLRDRVLPQRTPFQIAKLQALVVKLSNELEAARQLEIHEPTLAAVRGIAAQAAAHVCATSPSGGATDDAATAAGAGADGGLRASGSTPATIQVSNVVQATDRLFNPAGALATALDQMIALTQRADGIRECAREAAAGGGVVQATEDDGAADDGAAEASTCDASQRGLLAGASRALRAYADALGDALDDLLPTVASHVASAAPRAERWAVGGAYLATVGAWSRSLTQPGELTTQLARAACRAERAAATNTNARALYASGDCPGADETYTGDGGNGAAVRAIAHAQRLARWPEELAEAATKQQVVLDELDAIEPQAAVVQGVFAQLQGKFATARRVAGRMATVRPSVNVLKLASGSALAYSNELSARFDRLGRHLNGQPENAAFVPNGVWHHHHRIAAWEGALYWHATAAALDQLHATYLLARRDPWSCVAWPAAAGTPQADFTQRLLELEAAEEVESATFYSTQLPYAQITGVNQDRLAELTCLTGYLARRLAPHVNVETAEVLASQLPGASPPTAGGARYDVRDANGEAVPFEDLLALAARRAGTLDRCKSADWAVRRLGKVSTHDGILPLCWPKSGSTHADGAGWCALAERRPSPDSPPPEDETAGDWMYQQCYPTFTRDVNPDATDGLNTPAEQMEADALEMAKNHIPFHFSTIKPIVGGGLQHLNRLNFR